MTEHVLTKGWPRTDRYVAAVAWAAELHRSQGRKGRAIPYLSHLLAVSGLVLEHGGTEDQAIAGLLHDAIEDAGVTVEDISARFGPAVAGIVWACTDSDEVPKPPWRARKEAYMARLPAIDADALLVSLADKVHNVRTLAEDLEREGEATFDRFAGGADGSRWYYRRLAEEFEARRDDLPRAATSLLRELRLAVDRLGEPPPLA